MTTDIVTIKITELNTGSMIRKINTDGVERIAKRIDTIGYAQNKPILVDQNKILRDGHHRVVACKSLGIAELPVAYIHVDDELHGAQVSFRANEAEEDTIPQTFIDYAEYIWSAEGTQAEIADVLGWSVDKVKRYSALRKVTGQAWDAIVTAISYVTEEVTYVTFTENLLRPIIRLNPDQQIDLVDGLICGKYTTVSFKKQAENYKQQNIDVVALDEAISHVVSDDIYMGAVDEVRTGTYDLKSLIEWAVAKHNKETAIVIHHGDCIEGMKLLPDESVDLIATDPPYNMDKADWDSYGNAEEFAGWCESWMVECKRVLKPEGGMYIFGINRMLSHLQKWLDENMTYRNWIVWDTIQGAGGGLWTNRYESILYYSKTSETYEDTDAVKLERHEQNIREYKGRTYEFKNPSNVWRFPVVDGSHTDRTEHITQKPVEIMERIVTASCPYGGVVLDPFVGSGTTAIAAHRNDRKFVGYERDEANYKTAMRRVNDEISD